jgi:hypothetical protein
MPSAPQPGRLALALLLAALALNAAAQQAPRTRLYLKDGTYQLVLDYQIAGNVVRYHSAEREGAPEDIPVALVDFTATEHWQQQHLKGSSGPVLSPELAAEEEARRALHPEVAPGLHLPDEDSVVAFDSFHGTPELVPLSQFGSDLNRETAHAVQAMAIDPGSLAHRIAEITGAASDVQLHTLHPVFYLRIGSDDGGPITGGFVVDTHGAASSGRPTPTPGDARSTYVLERLEPRRDLRLLSSFRIAWLGTPRAQPNITELRQEPLPGNRWLRLTPTLPLEPGEYALVEVLSARDLNLDVWDFGVHPDAKESYEAIHPEVRKPPTLERRPQ